jgi:hypothetical protein
MAKADASPAQTTDATKAEAEVQASPPVSAPASSGIKEAASGSDSTSAAAPAEPQDRPYPAKPPTQKAAQVIKSIPVLPG